MAANPLDTLSALVEEYRLARKSGAVVVRLVLHRGGVRKIVVKDAVQDSEVPDKDSGSDCEMPPVPSL